MLITGKNQITFIFMNKKDNKTEAVGKTKNASKKAAKKKERQERREKEKYVLNNCSLLFIFAFVFLFRR